MRTPPPATPTRAMLAALLAAVLLGLLWSADPAAAADRPGPQWRASTSVKQGTDDQPFAIRTSGGCPPKATNIVGKIYGRGFPKDGANIIGNSDAGVSHEGPFEAPLYAQLRQVMLDNGTALAYRGDYRLVVRCRTQKYEKSYGDYVTLIRFTGPHTWKELPSPAKATGYQAPGTGRRSGGSGGPGASSAPTPGVSPDAPDGSGAPGSSDGAGQTTSSGAASASPGAAAGGGDAPGSTPTGAPTAAPATAASHGARDLGLVVAGAGLLVVLAAAYLFRRSSSAE